MDIRHILVATDLSAAASIAYGHSAAVARAWGARVTLLYVDELAEVGFHSSADMLTYIDQVGAVRQARLAQAEAAFDSAGIDVTVVEIPGHAATEIDRYADDNAVDLIVITRHGDHRTGPLGSTSQRVVRSATVPVLVVHEPQGYDGGAVAAPSYRRLVAATDFSEDSTIGLRAAVHYAARLDAATRVVHVWQSPGSALPLNDPELPAVPHAIIDELQARHEARFAAWLSQVGEGALDHAVVPGHSAAVGLIAAAIDWQADLICVPSHGTGAVASFLIGSTVDRLLTFSPLPVLVFPQVWLKTHVQG